MSSLNHGRLMRLIGHLDDERQARAFGDVLYAEDIPCEVEADGLRWAVWVRDEEQLALAAGRLEEFKRQPEDRRYVQAARVAREKRARVEADAQVQAERYFDRDRLFPERLYRLGVLTAILMGLSLLLTIATQFGSDALFSRWLAAAPFTRFAGYITFEPPLEALRSWEAWRWFTPMFVHMDLLHLLFNLWWLKDLGSLTEQRIGRGWFLLLIVAIAAPSNLAQLVLVAPNFGGMSGVNYGLFGYIWVRSRLDPGSGFAIDPLSVTILMSWFFLCLLNVIPHVANVVHTVGLAMGILAGFLATYVSRRRP